MIQSCATSEGYWPVAAIAVVALCLTGCGVAETGAVVATQGVASAEQAREAEAQLENVQRRIDEAQAVAGQLRDEAEAAAE